MQPRDETNSPVGSDRVQPVYVIDDDVIIRRSLHSLLSTAGFTCWPFASASDFLENLPNLEAAPILLDIRMPEIDGIALMTTLLDRDVKWPIIIITAHADIPMAVNAIKLGAMDLLEKPLDLDLLKKCLGTAMENLRELKVECESQSTARHLIGSLSPREFEVINLLMAGAPNKIVAHRLGVSVRTVEMHRSNALLKLKVKTIPEAIRLTTEAGIMRI